MINSRIMVDDTNHPRFGDRGVVVSDLGDLVEVQMEDKDPNRCNKITYRRSQLREIKPSYKKNVLYSDR